MSFLRSRLLFSDSTKYIEDFEEFEKTINRATGSKMVSFTSSRYGLEKEIFDSFDEFELEDKSQMNEYDRRIEHSELLDSSLYKRSAKM